MTQFNDFQQIKRQLYAMRNGIIADTLRRAGSTHRLIFGVNLPQLSEIASGIQPNAEMARRLWQDTALRESMLLAPMIFPPEEMTVQEARLWIQTVSGTECADILCHRLLRKLPYSYELALECAKSSKEIERYIALRILWHFIGIHPDEIYSIAEAEIKCNNSMTLRLARQTLDEIQFLREVEE